MSSKTDKTPLTASAEEFNRTVDPEHFGVNLTYNRGPLSPDARDALIQRRPEVDPERLVPTSRAALQETIDAWIDAGYSKFLLRPAQPPPDWNEELEELASDVLGRPA